MKSTYAFAAIIFSMLAAPLSRSESEAEGDAILYNQDPNVCCTCIAMEVNKQQQVPGEQQATPEPDKQGNVSVEVTVSHTGGTDCPDSIKFTVSAQGTDGPASLPDQSGTVGAGESVTLTFVITPDERRICEDWEFTLTCEKSGAYCDRQEITLGPCGESCTSCDGDTAEPSASQPGGASGDSPESGAQSTLNTESVPGLGGDPPSRFLGYDVTFSAIIPTTRSNGGMSNGSLRFEARDFTFPGRAGLIGNASRDFTTTRLSDILSKVQTNAGAAEIEITDGPAQNGFTVTHRDPEGFAFRTTVISWLNDNGVQRLRMDSTYDGTTMRHEQTQPQPGTLVLQKGRVIDGTFVPLHSESLTKTTARGTRVYRRKVEERASGSHPWVLVSDTATTWEKQIFGWMKTQEVINPGGAALTSTWTYYQPGDFPDPAIGISTGPPALHKAVGRLKHHIRYDGYEEFHSYSLFSHSVTTPYAGNVAGKTTLSTWDPGSRVNSITTKVGDTILSRTVRTHTPGGLNVDEYNSENDKLTTVHIYKGVNQDFGGKPEKTFHPDGTLTTYKYTRLANGGYTTETDHGAPDEEGTAVAMGTRTITTRNSRGTVILSKTTAIGHGTGSSVFSSMAVTSVDNLGRVLVTAHHPATATPDGEAAAVTGGAAYITRKSYSCCGVASETDMYGVKTFYAYDGLRRRIKTNTLGVTIETVHTGIPAGDNPDGNTPSIFTVTHRYPWDASNGISSTLVDNEANRISETRRNLSGTIRESWSPDPTALDEEGEPEPGALAATISTTTFKPAPGISTRTVTETPDGFEQTTDSFLDGRTHKTTGVLAPHMEYAYSVNSTGELTARAYLDGSAHREITGTQTDRLGRTLVSGQLPSLTSSEFLASVTMEYNALGQMTKSTDPDGVVTLMRYNDRGERTVTAIDLSPNSESITYGTDTVQSSETVPALRGGIPVWRTTGRVWQDDDTSPGGTIVSQTDRAANGLESWSWQIGQGASPTDPSATFTTSVTDLVQDANEGGIGTGEWTETTTRPDNTQTTAFYEAGLLRDTAIRDTSGNVVDGMAYAYDSYNRQISATDARRGAIQNLPANFLPGAYTSILTNYVSNTADHVMSTGEPVNLLTAYTYDIRGRRIQVDAPDTLDADGAPLTNITNTAYNPDGTVQETTGAQTYRTTHTYDYAQRMVTMTTYGTQTATTEWKYSPDRGFLVEKNYHGESDNGDATDADYLYTDAGRLRSRRWERGVVTTYGYDKAGRLTLTDYNDATPDVITSYDALGRPLTIMSGQGSLDGEIFTIANPIASSSFLYNAGNLATDKETITYNLPGVPTFTRVLDRSQDNLGRNSGFTLGTQASPSAIETAVTYDYSPTDGRLSEISNPQISNSFTYGYEPNSYSMIKTVTGPVHTVTNTWNQYRDILGSKQNKVGGVEVSGYVYGVNEIGQRINVAQTGSAFTGVRDITWGYDALGQVVKADSAIPGLDRAYQYDQIGNRISSTDGTGAVTGYFANTGGTTGGGNPLNQYASISYPGSTTLQPVHDADGNMTSGPVPGVNGLSAGVPVPANATLHWDAENRLVEVVVNGKTVEYAYDARSRLIARTEGSATAHYLYDGWNRIAEYDVDGTVHTLARTYLWGIDLSGTLQGAGGVGGLLAMTVHGTATATFYPTYDGNGNVSEYLAENGTTAAHFEYDPFGNLTADKEGNAGEFPYRFSTKPQDPVTGLYYYGYRWYDVLNARWSSRDPIEESGGVNLYGFVGNSPSNAFDVLGLDEKKLTQNLTPIKENYVFDMDERKGVDGITQFSIQMEQTPTQCRVIVTVYVNLVGGIIYPIGGEKQGMGYEDQKGYKPLTDAEAKAKLPDLQKGIESAWNNKFQICCDEMRYGVGGQQKIFHTGAKRNPTNKFDRNKYYQSACCCDVVFKLEQHPSGIKVGLFEMPVTGSNQQEWNMTNPGHNAGQTAAHEFGHMIGNIDEYNGGNNAKYAGTDRDYGPQKSNNPDSIMGPKGGKGNPGAEHLWRVLDSMNSSQYTKGCKVTENK